MDSRIFRPLRGLFDAVILATTLMVIAIPAMGQTYLGASFGSSEWNATSNDPSKYELETHTGAVPYIAIEAGRYYSRGRFGLELGAARYDLHGINGDFSRLPDGTCSFRTAGGGWCKIDADGNILTAITLHAVGTVEPFGEVLAGIRPYILAGGGFTYLWATPDNPDGPKVSGSAITPSAQLGIGLTRAFGRIDLDVGLRHLRALSVDVDGHDTSYWHSAGLITARYRFWVL